MSGPQAGRCVWPWQMRAALVGHGSLGRFLHTALPQDGGFHQTPAGAAPRDRLVQHLRPGNRPIFRKKYDIAHPHYDMDAIIVRMSDKSVIFVIIHVGTFCSSGKFCLETFFGCEKRK